VAVIGPGEADPQTCGLAVETGRLLARARAVVVCGGLGGVMEAAARGAQEAGGVTLGILPGAQRSAANRHLTLAVASGLGEARNALVVSASDAVVAVGFSWGTLSEVALAARAGKAVVALGGWTLRDEYGDPVSGLARADSPAQAVERVFAALGLG
jgi:uncharacterized protein (TIGR00725 family)